MNIKKAFNIFDLVVFRSSIQCFFPKMTFFPEYCHTAKGGDCNVLKARSQNKTDLNLGLLNVI